MYISLKQICFANNVPFCLQDMTFLVLNKKFESILKSMEFEYECGNFESSNEKKVSFVRVANVSDVVKKSVTQLNESGFFC